MGPWRGFKFSELDASKIEFQGINFSSKRSSLKQTFVEHCVDFEVAHLSVLMVQRLLSRSILVTSR